MGWCCANGDSVFRVVVIAGMIRGYRGCSRSSVNC